MNIMKTIPTFGALALAAAAGAAQADDAGGKLWLHLGAAHVRFHPSVDVAVGPAPFANVPDARLSSNNALVFDAGYEVLPGTVVSLMAGTPPTTTLSSGAFGGDLGRVKYGPAILSAHYHFDAGAVRPYLGLGVAYAMVLSSKDAGLTGLDVKSAWGTALVAGAEVPLSPRYALYVDVRKLALKTTGSAMAGGVQARIRLDPTIISAGVALRF